LVADPAAEGVRRGERHDGRSDGHAHGDRRKAVDAISGRTFVSENPYTGQGWATAPDADRDDVEVAVAAAQSALDGEWGQLTGFARAALLRRLGDLISDHARELAQLEVSDSGKLYREMIGQMNGLGSWYHYYAGLADKLEGRQIPSRTRTTSSTPGASRWVSSRRSRRGTRRCCC
jgi:acyl-CoA reductase-like NAD-dependent aldehyde dehydrogenase